MILDNLKEYRVILASNSPRRRELLAGLGVEQVLKVKGLWLADEKAFGW